MTRIKSSPSIGKQRIHASFVERNRIVVDRASSVGPVTPVNPVHNNVGYSSVNHLMTSDLLYDKLEDLKRDYLNFYNQERNFHRTVSEMDLDEDIQIEMMEKLLDKYNKAVISLNSFDLQLRTNNVDRIKNIILEHSTALSNLGIYIVRDKELEINEEIYISNLIDSRDDREDLFRPLNNMFLLLYKEFRNIKGPYGEHFDEKYPELAIEDCSGILLDAKS